MVAQQRPVTNLGNNHWCARAQPSIYVRVPNTRRNNLGKIQWAVSLFPVSVEHVRGDYSVDYPNDRTHTGCTFSSSPAPSPPRWFRVAQPFAKACQAKMQRWLGQHGRDGARGLDYWDEAVLSEEKLRAHEGGMP